jgi:hypothetical protein
VSRISVRAFTVLALSIAVGLATAVAPFASSSPDGLERVARDKAFLERGAPRAIQEDSPVAGYAFPGVGNERVATGLAGFAGSLIVFVLGHGLALAVKRRHAGGHESARARATA